jgi:hypothetical protein
MRYAYQQTKTQLSVRVCNYNSIKHVVISFIHPSMILQPFVGPWPLLQFRNLFLHSR